ncbi:unnamed protein product [Lepidochelys olivacea]
MFGNAGLRVGGWLSGYTGNMLPGVTVLTNRQMWTVTMFILNLAIHDLLVGTFCMPTTLVDNLITE